MPGPLPNPNRRRRNAPTIATKNLPAKGRKGRLPKPPYELGDAGLAWWKWAWRTPQSTQWDQGALYAAARRAQFEDDIEALASVESLDVSELLDDDGTRLKALIMRLKRLAGGYVTVAREMRELDKRLGLDPKALEELRWHIAAEDDDEAAPAPQDTPAAVNPPAPRTRPLAIDTGGR